MDDPEYICMICLDEIKNDIWTCTECGRIFHKKCIQRWGKNCPKCQTNISFNDVIVINTPRSSNCNDILIYTDPYILYFVLGSIFLIFLILIAFGIYLLIWGFYPFGNYTAYNTSIIYY